MIRADWQWGAGERVPHVAVLLYARSGRLAAWEREIEAQCAAGFVRIERLSTSDTQGAEPFGFADGISQPQVDWERKRPVRDQDQLEYSNVSCLGEFLLGYPNEYGLYTPRPLLAPQRDPDASAAEGRRRAGAGRPRTQRLLSRDAPAAAGRATFLARARPASGRRCGLARAAGRGDGGPKEKWRTA